MGAIVGVLGKVGTAILMSLLTEKVLIKLVLIILNKLVKSTNNTLDDEMYKAVEEALTAKS